MKPFRYAALLLLLAGGGAWADDRVPDRIITVNVFPQKAAPAARAESAKGVAKQREARLKSIADALARYNPKLSSQKARTYAEYVLQAGERFGQDPFILAAMIVRESSARPDVVSKGGDYGLMQVRWRVHQKRIQKEYPQVRRAKDLCDPKINIMVGAEIFAECCASLPPEKRRDVRSGLLRYSAGNTKMADRVLATAKELERSYQRYLKTG